MIISPIQATIFYSHDDDEVAELAEAIKPLSDHVRAVGSEADRHRLRSILSGNHFRRSDVSRVKSVLLRAAKHARSHLAEYFPLVQQDVIANAEALEDAVGRYHKQFRALLEETIPLN